MPRRNPRNHDVRVRSYTRKSGVQVKGHHRVKTFHGDRVNFRTEADEKRAISVLRHNREMVLQSGAVTVLESTGVPSIYGTNNQTPACFAFPP